MVFNFLKIVDQVRCSHTTVSINQKRFLESVSVVINREVGEQIKLTLEGGAGEFIYFISPYLHQGTVKDMKLDAELFLQLKILPNKK